MISYQCKGKGKGCSWESRAGTCSRDLQCLQLREPLVKYPQHRTIHCLHGMMDPRRRLFSISCALPPTSPVRHMCQQSSASPPSTKTALYGSSTPMYTQVVYCLERVPVVVKAKRSWPT